MKKRILLILGGLALIVFSIWAVSYYKDLSTAIMGVPVGLLMMHGKPI